MLWFWLKPRGFEYFLPHQRSQAHVPSSTHLFPFFTFFNINLWWIRRSYCQLGKVDAFESQGGRDVSGVEGKRYSYHGAKRGVIAPWELPGQQPIPYNATNPTTQAFFLIQASTKHKILKPPYRSCSLLPALHPALGSRRPNCVQGSIGVNTPKPQEQRQSHQRLPQWNISNPGAETCSSTFPYSSCDTESHLSSLVFISLSLHACISLWKIGILQ